MNFVGELHPETSLVPGELMATLAHEMRQPLSNIEAIAYYLSLIVPVEDVRVQGQLRAIRQLVDQSNCILASGVQLDRNADTHPEPVDLSELVREVMRDAGLLHADGLGGWELDADSDVVLELSDSLVPVLFDRQQGREMIETLFGWTRTLTKPLRAGIDASPQLLIRTGGMSEGGTVLEFACQDLLEPAPSTVSSPGLVLTSVSRIAQAHGGRLEIDRNPEPASNRGISVRVVLP